MHQTAKARFIFPEGDGTGELRLTATTVLAPDVAHQQLRTEQEITADNALRLAHRRDSSKTFGADRNPGDIIEWSVAQPAIGSEKDGKNVAQEGLQRRENYGTLLGALT